MPTKTFFNLPEGKRKKLMEAVRQEFSRVPFDEVSINKIIHAAEIPRGSFYQYFKDKHDTLYYLLADYRNTMLESALESLDRTQGDLFQMFIDIYDFTCQFVLQMDKHAFFKNLFSDIRINMELYTSQTEQFACGYVEELAAHVNLAALDVREEEDFEDIFGIMVIVLGDAIAQTFFDVEKCECVRAGYVKRLERLKRGFLKNREALCSDI